jgi:hypothetical protein
MADTGYRLWLGAEPATEEELARVEEIVVEQEMDAAWEARVCFSLCLDEQGRWKHGNEAFTQPFSRLRVEMLVNGAATPLIDGSIASVDSNMDAQPGRSSITLVVHDDRFLLDRAEAVDVRAEATEAALASELFDGLPQPEMPHRIQAPDNDAARVMVRRGSPMAYLASLARVRNWHAYVLPGSAPGSSIGCYLPDPSDPPTLPALTLMGAERSLTNVQVSQDGAGPQQVSASALRFNDQSAEAADTAQQEQALLRDFPAVPLDRQATRLLPPEENNPEQLAARTAGRASRAAAAYRLSAQVLPGCYSAVLTPYNKISIRAGDSPLSGDWVLTKVTHRITPSIYTQDIEARSDSHADTAAPADPSGGPGGLSLDFSASLSLF